MSDKDPFDFSKADKIVLYGGVKYDNLEKRVRDIDGLEYEQADAVFGQSGKLRARVYFSEEFSYNATEDVMRMIEAFLDEDEFERIREVLE